MTQQLNKSVQPVLHVRFEGRSQMLELYALKLDVNSSDGQLKQALARYLDCPASDFST